VGRKGGGAGGKKKDRPGLTESKQVWTRKSIRPQSKTLGEVFKEKQGGKEKQHYLRMGERKLKTKSKEEKRAKIGENRGPETAPR